jgi:hypothetical protein
MDCHGLQRLTAPQFLGGRVIPDDEGVQRLHSREKLFSPRFVSDLIDISLTILNGTKFVFSNLALIRDYSNDTPQILNISALQVQRMQKHSHIRLIHRLVFNPDIMFGSMVLEMAMVGALNPKPEWQSDNKGKRHIFCPCLRKIKVVGAKSYTVYNPHF